MELEFMKEDYVLVMDPINLLSTEILPSNLLLIEILFPDHFFTVEHTLIRYY